MCKYRTYDLRFWHCFFGIPGTLNDINVLQRSPLFDETLTGAAPSVKYKINEKEHEGGYYLADGIYPKYATLMTTISTPKTLAEEKFATLQEAYRKDIERAFGVLQSRFRVVSQASRSWSSSKMMNVMYTCCILHNMIMADRNLFLKKENEEIQRTLESTTTTITPGKEQRSRDEIIRDQLINTKLMFNAERHKARKQDLVDHVWKKYNDRQIK